MTGLERQGGQIGLLGALEIAELHQCIAPVVMGGRAGGAAIGGDGPGVVTGAIPGIPLPDGILEVAGRRQVAPLLEGLPGLPILPRQAWDRRGGGARLQGRVEQADTHAEQEQPERPDAGQQCQRQQGDQQPGAEIPRLVGGQGLAHGQRREARHPGLQPLQLSP
ncbi:hypothetical protein D3C72_1949650 [compost metagenome]